MDKKKLEELIAPVEVAHVTGQRFPKDLYYRMNSKLVARFTLCMPDNMLISVPIYEGESSKDKINSFIVAIIEVVAGRVFLKLSNVF